MELYTRTDRDSRIEVTTREYISHGIKVPVDFPFDGASAPRFFWAIIPPFKMTKKAAVVHDWLCRDAKCAYDRKKADELFYVMLLEAGISKARARLGYLGVRLGALMGVGVYY